MLLPWCASLEFKTALLELLVVPYCTCQCHTAGHSFQSVYLMSAAGYGSQPVEPVADTGGCIVLHENPLIN